MGILGIGIIYFLSYYIISASPIRKDIFPLSQKRHLSLKQAGVKSCQTPPLLRGIPPPIGTPLIKGGRGDRHPPYQGGAPRLSAPPLSRGSPPPIGTPLIKGEPPAYRHPPYQGGQGGSNPKYIFNLIITSYLS